LNTLFAPATLGLHVPDPVAVKSNWMYPPLLMFTVVVSTNWNPLLPEKYSELLRAQYVCSALLGANPKRLLSSVAVFRTSTCVGRGRIDGPMYTSSSAQ